MIMNNTQDHVLMINTWFLFTRNRLYLAILCFIMDIEINTLAKEKDMRKVDYIYGYL